MNPETLGRYLGMFGNLNRRPSKEHGAAPHKPILLLAVLDEIERGAYPSNFITITPELVASFRAYWRVLVPPVYWQEKMAYPFRHLLQDGFWELVKDGHSLTSSQIGDIYTIGQLEKAIDGAMLTPDLWQLLQDKTALNALRTFLLQTYFSRTEADVQEQMPVDLLEAEAEQLKAEAKSKFRVKKIKETADDTGYYVRHALFPKVVKSLYQDACTVCDLAARTEKGSGIVDAAHIMPFGLFHNDDPRNGITFCKNHHWGFDAGWFTISDEYKILVSPQLQNGLGYVTSGSSIRLPSNTIYAPAKAALTWHRDTKFLK